jgi:hypothetical protein
MHHSPAAGEQPAPEPRPALWSAGGSEERARGGRFATGLGDHHWPRERRNGFLFCRETGEWSSARSKQERAPALQSALQIDGKTDLPLPGGVSPAVHGRGVLAAVRGGGVPAAWPGAGRARARRAAGIAPGVRGGRALGRQVLLRPVLGRGGMPSDGSGSDKPPALLARPAVRPAARSATDHSLSPSARDERLPARTAVGRSGPCRPTLQALPACLPFDGSPSCWPDGLRKPLAAPKATVSPLTF